MAASPGLAIEATGLVKRYGDLVAVDGVDVRVQQGTCLGLLGPNGAGKTTTIEILEGLGVAGEGETHILGLSWKDSEYEIRERIGVQLQDTRLQEKLTVFETLRLFRSFYAHGRDPEEVLELVALKEKSGARVVTLSGGQHQRLALGCALINHPDLLFLDEPTTGLDPQARRRVWEIVEDFKRAGGSVLLTTHYMDEAEKLANDLIIMDHGRTIAEGSPAAIIKSLGAESILEFILADGDEGAAPEVDHDSLAALPCVKDVRSVSGTMTLSVTDTQTALDAVLEWLREHGRKATDLRAHRPTLEDVFVALTGKHLRDE
jgi:ABC-2 type transport system ATP-binding protein